MSQSFTKKSHGFRPERSCHTALMQVKSIFTGAKWFIEGDIKACFDSFDHHILVKILRRRIKDESFIELIWKLLKAGYLEDWKYVNSYSGIPQGSGCSPILANIYLSELDWYIEEMSRKMDTREKNRKKVNPEYGRISAEISRKRKRNKKEWEHLDQKSRKERLREIRELSNKQLQIQPQLEIESQRKWMEYVRYADDFLIGISGSKEDARKTKQEIAEYLKEELHLTLSMEKTKITHTFREQMKKLTCRSWGVSNGYKVKKLNQLIRGWINYFKIGSMKGLCERLDSQIRYRLRMCIWKHWKTPQNRAKNLIKLGISRKYAWSTAYTGARIAYVCQRGAMNVAVTKERLTRFGLVSMSDYYAERRVTC